MALQKIFEPSYANFLWQEVKEGRNLSRYSMDIFPIDESKALYMDGIVVDVEALQDAMIKASSDYDAAIVLYETYKKAGLTRLQASDDAFWLYLTHVDLFQYMKKRFPTVVNDKMFGKYNKDDETKENQDKAKSHINYVGIHWMFQRETVRNGLAGLWWDVYCTVDENDIENPYKFTRFLFDHYDMRSINFANYALFRNKAQVRGIIGWLMKHEDVTATNFQNRLRFIAKHFNRMGATKQMVFMDEQFFHDELDKIYNDILSVPVKTAKSEEEIDEEE